MKWKQHITIRIEVHCVSNIVFGAVAYHMEASWVWVRNTTYQRNGNELQYTNNELHYIPNTAFWVQPRFLLETSWVWMQNTAYHKHGDEI